MDYHIGVGGKQEGPLPEAEVRRRIAAGELKNSDLCWTVGWTAWRPLAGVFFDAFGGPPPALSPPVPPPVRLSAPVLAQIPPRAEPLQRTDGMAVASLVLGVMSMVMCGILAGVPAVICGHVSRGNIRKYHGRLGGAGMALGGLIMGYIAIAMTLVMVPVIIFAISVPAIKQSKVLMQEIESQNHLREIAQACLVFAGDHAGRLPGGLADIESLLTDPATTFDLPHTAMHETAGYALVPGITTAHAATTIIAYETVPRRDGSRAVAHLDGTVTVLPVGDPELDAVLRPVIPKLEAIPLPEVELELPLQGADEESVKNLRRVADAARRFARENRGRFPSFTEQLRASIGPEFDALMDLPLTPERETNGYVLRSGVTLQHPPDTPIAFESRPREDGARAVAFLDGRIAVLPRGDPDLRRALE